MKASETSGQGRSKRKYKKIIFCILCLGLLGFLVDIVAGSFLIAPQQCQLQKPVIPGCEIEAVEFPSASGATVKGWLIPSKESKGVIILMHGVYAQRETLTNRVPFLHAAGYSLLLFDFQASGETVGNHVTFGYLESRDAAAAVAFVKQKFPGQKIAALGVSMGGAAALLAQPPLAVNALIVESVYPTIQQAIEDRIMIRFGPPGKYLAPLLTWQLKPRLGFGVEDLCPIHRVGQILVPKFFLAGDADRDTTLEESQALFAAAAEPKQLWIVGGAKHQDLYHFGSEEYEKRVLEFLGKYLH